MILNACIRTAFEISRVYMNLFLFSESLLFLKKKCTRYEEVI